MIPTHTDPAGLLARIPQLESLCRYDGVRRAVERGDSFALYRALRWGSWLGRFDVRDAETARSLLAQRSLFVRPVNGAPALFTMNGLGTTVYGDDERSDRDDAYIKTHFLVVLFVPVFPLGAYLVRDAGDGTRAWVFYGRVPLGPLTWLWSRLVGLAALCATAFFVGAAVLGSMYSTVHVVNGLDEPVIVRIGDEDHEIPPRLATGVAVRIPREPQRVETRTLAGRVIEQGTIAPERGDDAYVWNVLGAAPVFVARVIYTEHPTDEPPGQPTVHCGESGIGIPIAHYVFEEPDERIDLPRGEPRVTRTYVGVNPGGLGYCYQWLQELGRSDAASELAARTGTALGWTASRFESLRAAAELEGDREPVLVAAREWRDAEPTSLDAHRAYQTALVELGRREGARAEYAARLAASPGDLDAEYLVLRLAAQAEAAPRASELLAAHPEHLGLARIVAYQQMRAHDYASAAQAFETLINRSDGEERAQFVYERARALTGAGRASDARALLTAEIERAPVNLQRALAALYARLGADDPLALSRALQLPGDAAPQSEPLQRLWARLDIGTAELGPLSPENERFVQVNLEATRDPGRALTAARGLDRFQVSSLDEDLYALLYAEACRRDGADSALAQQLASARTEMAATIAQLLADGVHTPEVDDLSIEVVAAVELVRSRVTTISSEERAALRERVVRGDPLGDGPARALARWPDTL